MGLMVCKVYLPLRCSTGRPASSNLMSNICSITSAQDPMHVQQMDTGIAQMQMLEWIGQRKVAHSLIL